MLQDARTAIGTLDPAKSFGASAFGKLHLRPILADGSAGDWVPLATLVRLPTFAGYSCPPDAAQPCTLTGTGLFLLESVAADPQFAELVKVPDGFAASVLEVPRASNGQLFAKLRDDPAVVSTVAIEASPHTANRRHAGPEGAPGRRTPLQDDPADGIAAGQGASR